MCSYGAIYISNSDGVVGSNCCNGPGVTVVAPEALRVHMALMALIDLMAPMAYMYLHLLPLAPRAPIPLMAFIMAPIDSLIPMTP